MSVILIKRSSKTPYFMWVPLSNTHKKPEQSESWLLSWLYWPLCWCVPHFSGEVVCRTIFLSSFLCFLSRDWSGGQGSLLSEKCRNQGRGLMQLSAATSPTESKTVSRISVVPLRKLSEKLMRVLCYLFLKNLRTSLSSLKVTSFLPHQTISSSVSVFKNRLKQRRFWRF